MPSVNPLNYASGLNSDKFCFYFSLVKVSTVSFDHEVITTHLPQNIQISG